MNNLMKIKKSIEYIELNIKEVITLDDLAEACQVSKYHFHRIFLAVTGNTVMKYNTKSRSSSTTSIRRYLYIWP